MDFALFTSLSTQTDLSRDSGSPAPNGGDVPAEDAFADLFAALEQAASQSDEPARLGQATADLLVTTLEGAPDTVSDVARAALTEALEEVVTLLPPQAQEDPRLSAEAIRQDPVAALRAISDASPLAGSVPQAVSQAGKAVATALRALSETITRDPGANHGTRLAEHLLANIADASRTDASAARDAAAAPLSVGKEAVKPAVVEILRALLPEEGLTNQPAKSNANTSISSTPEQTAVVRPGVPDQAGSIPKGAPSVSGPVVLDTAQDGERLATLRPPLDGDGLERRFARAEPGGARPPVGDAPAALSTLAAKASGLNASVKIDSADTPAQTATGEIRPTATGSVGSADGLPGLVSQSEESPLGDVAKRSDPSQTQRQPLTGGAGSTIPEAAAAPTAPADPKIAAEPEARATLRTDAGDEGRVYGPSAGLSSDIAVGSNSTQSARAVAAAVALPSGPEAARVVVPQIASAIATQHAPGRIEIQLDPPELGRIEIALEIADQGLRATLSAERAMTGDMIRRHGELLLQQLQNAGFSDVDLRFGDTQRDDQGDRGQRPELRDSGSAPVDGKAPTALGASASDGLDLRL